MAVIEVKKVKIKWRAVEFDASQGSESFADLNELLSWCGNREIVNNLDEWMPNIEVPEKKPTYPGETRPVYVQHGGYIVANNRGKVEVLTDDEFYERFKEKNK